MIRAVLLCTAVAVLGCTRVEDPWVSGDRLAAERARAPDVARALDHRIQRVQRDR